MHSIINAGLSHLQTLQRYFGTSSRCWWGFSDAMSTRMVRNWQSRYAAARLGVWQNTKIFFKFTEKWIHSSMICCYDQLLAIFSDKKMGVSITLSACSVLKATLRLNNSEKNCKQTMMNIYERSWRAGKIDKQEKSEKNLDYSLYRPPMGMQWLGKWDGKRFFTIEPARSASTTREIPAGGENLGRSKVMRLENCLNHKWTLAVNHCTSNTRSK